ncbi:MAG TPA: ABC transporter transmembrane domain-containing protein, partial [Dehalococcoidia bacterium]
MGMWGGAGAGGWSHQGAHVRPGQYLRRGSDGWDDEELGKVYDHSVVRRLLPYLRPYRGRAFTAIFAMIIFAAVSRTQPFLIGLAVDKYIKNEDLKGVALIGLVLLGLALAGWLAQWLQQVMTAFMGHRILLTLRTQMFNHIQKLSLSFLDRNETGRVMSRVTSDVTVLQELLTTGFLTVFADFVGIGIVVGFLLYQDVQLTFITLSVVPLLVLL